MPVWPTGCMSPIASCSWAPARTSTVYTAAADVFVLPSWYEPFGNVFLEALASGLPVVATRDIGGAEAVKEGVNGFKVAFPVRPEELAEKIKAALALDREVMLGALPAFLSKFSWEKNLARTLAVYEEIFGRIRPTGKG